MDSELQPRVRDSQALKIRTGASKCHLFLKLLAHACGKTTKPFTESPKLKHIHIVTSNYESAALQCVCVWENAVDRVHWPELPNSLRSSQLLVGMSPKDCNLYHHFTITLLKNCRQSRFNLMNGIFINITISSSFPDNKRYLFRHHMTFQTNSLLFTAACTIEARK